eukprot:TRINITY_DN8560_c0_g1_i1.p1 TRINITY_DN8560_c0_g1~~TRINITY_DN8560_c0_g1_i1.p1  ORF type:complete len:308 (-),score=110.08 TRINITY_DN8560_c0_g1_i1:156-1079(-)
MEQTHNEPNFIEKFESFLSSEACKNELKTEREDGLGLDPSFSASDYDLAFCLFVRNEYEFRLEDQKRRLGEQFMRQEISIYYNVDFCILRKFPLAYQLKHIKMFLEWNWEGISCFGTGKAQAIDVQKLIFHIWKDFEPKSKRELNRDDPVASEIGELLHKAKEVLKWTIGKPKKLMYPKAKEEFNADSGMHHLFGLIPLCGKNRWKILEHFSTQYFNDECDELMRGFLLMKEVEELKEPLMRAITEWKRVGSIYPFDGSTGMGWQMVHLFMNFQRKGIILSKDPRLEDDFEYIEGFPKWLKDEGGIV